MLAFYRFSELTNSVRHGHRDPSYNAYNYYQEFGLWRDAWNNDANVQNKSNLIGPSLSLAEWQMEDVWNTPFLQDYAGSLSALTVEK